MDARSLHLLAKTTVLKSESLKGFQELVRQHLLRIAPRDAVEQTAVEEICSATWRLHRLRAIERKTIDLELATQSSPDDLECLARACGALAGKNPHLLFQRHETRLQNIIRRSLNRIETLRRIEAQKNSTKPPPRGTPRVSRPLGRPANRNVRRSLNPCASGHTSPSLGLHPVNPKNLRLRRPTEAQEKPKKNPRKPKKNPPKPTETQEKPSETRRHTAGGGGCPNKR
jgi:hypothetical protein